MCRMRSSTNQRVDVSKLVQISSTVMPSPRWLVATRRLGGRSVGCSSVFANRRTHRSAITAPWTPMSSIRSAFCNASSKVRPIAITSPTDFMPEPTRVETPRNFFKVPARHLDHHVVEGGLEAGAGDPGHPSWESRRQRPSPGRAWRPQRPAGNRWPSTPVPSCARGGR